MSALLYFISITTIVFGVLVVKISLKSKCVYMHTLHSHAHARVRAHTHTHTHTLSIIIIFMYIHTIHSLLSQRIPLVKSSGSNQEDTSRPESPLRKKSSSDRLQSTSTPSFAAWTNKRQESFEVYS